MGHPVYKIQHDERDCGPTCLYMVSAYYGLKRPLSFYRKLTKMDKNGSNIYGLVDAGSKIGFETVPLVSDLNDLLTELQSGKLTFPFIAHVSVGSRLPHYVVIYSYHNGHFLIGDPSHGRVVCSTEQFSSIWTGCVVSFRPTESFQRGNFMPNALLSFFSLLKVQRKKLIGIFFLSIIVSCIGIVGSLVFELVIDNVVSTSSDVIEQNDSCSDVHTDAHSDDTSLAFSPHQEGFSGILSVHPLQTIFVSLIFLYLVMGIIHFLRGILLSKVSKSVDIEIIESYYSHIMDATVDSVSSRRTGEYLSRLSDASLIRQAISTATITFMLDTLMVLGCGLILFNISKEMFLVSLIVIILYALIFCAYCSPLERNNRHLMESNAIFQSYVKESIDGIETIKALNISEHSKKTASEKFSQFVDSAMRYNVLSFSLDALSGAVEAIGIAVILWIGFYSVRANIITIGKLITFYSLLSSFIEPIKNIINLQPTIQAAVIAAERINDILDLDIEDSASSSTTTLKAIDLLEVKNVSFRYGNGLLILENVALSIKKGEKIAIVGQSGCGKSTLAKLFLRFYLPESGHIQINGTNIDCFDLSSLRNSIAYISQNPFFFADTIRNNLTNGNEEISDEQIEAVCKMCLANQFIETLPLGYDTVLSENGENLSNGQRQKIALARALLANPQILILDEATCNLDSVSEKKINEMLSYNFSNMSCIFITHRLSTLEGCSNIYVMESGKIIGSGTHSELMHSQDQYRELWNQQ